LLSSSIDQTVRLWDVESGTELQKFDLHDNPARSAKFTLDGRQILFGDGKQAVLWNPEGNREIWRSSIEKSHVVTVGISPDGRLAVTGMGRGKIVLWNVQSGHKEGTLLGHSGIPEVQFSPDGRHIISSSPDDRTLRVWSVKELRETHRVETKHQSLVTLVISPDGRHALTAGHWIRDETDSYWTGDGDLHVWQLPKSVWPELQPVDKPDALTKNSEASEVKTDSGEESKDLQSEEKTNKDGQDEQDGSR
jgi:WD40 repeat protein